MDIFSFLNKIFIFDINVDSSAVIGNNTAIPWFSLPGFPSSDILQTNSTISQVRRLTWTGSCYTEHFHYHRILLYCPFIDTTSLSQLLKTTNLFSVSMIIF